MKVMKKIFVFLLMVGILFSNFFVVHAEDDPITIDAVVEKANTVMDDLMAFMEEQDGTTINQEGTSLEIRFVKEGDNIKALIEGVEPVTIATDFGEKLKFETTVTITDGMSYDDYQEAMSASSILMLYPYMAVANLKGVEPQDSYIYLMMMSLASAFSSASNSNGPTITLVEPGEGVEVQNAGVPDENGNVTITPDMFGDYAVRYASQSAKNGVILQDSADGNSDADESEADYLNSMKMTSTIVTQNDDQLVVKYTFEIDPEADFSKLNGAFESFASSFTSTDDELEGIKVPDTFKSILTNKLFIVTSGVILVGLVLLVVRKKKIN